MPKTLRIGHSPDPDDAFMYYAIAHGKVPVGSYQVQHVLEEIESLNIRAMNQELEVTAISAATYPLIASSYQIMSSGASIGRNYGPILVARESLDLAGARIAVPGLHTTAHLLLRLYLENFEAIPMPFDAILPAVQKGEIGAGLIIHEGQLTYKSLGLKKLLDLGESWGKETGLPIPLGLDMVRRDLGPEVVQLLVDSLRDSIRYGFQHETEAMDYAAKFARDVPRETCRSFVKMYVNEDTMDMGEEGRLALETLFSKAHHRGLIDVMPPLDIA